MMYDQVLREIRDHIQPEFGKGRVAAYIPPLAAVSGKKFGMAIQCINGENFEIGDADERFSIQSISKVFTLSLAIGFVGDELWRRVGREPSGNAFNSLV